MTKYLTVITTVLVLTQIIRVTQNAIQLHKLNEDVESNNREVRRVRQLLHLWLLKQLKEEEIDAE